MLKKELEALFLIKDLILTTVLALGKSKSSV
jgi:hypothetical protein